ncbi:hypothetical protein BGX38DRAFT_1170456 [Terfezia claveryi]|nr:hypothetical protein BGX38DRAFT_1170456 [Terfezia claveryi]
MCVCYSPVGPPIAARAYIFYFFLFFSLKICSGDWSRFCMHGCSASGRQDKTENGQTAIDINLRGPIEVVLTWRSCAR